MGNDSDWSAIAEEEHALLSLCRKHVLGSPDAPGGGAKDILYFTPSGQWLRICSRAAYYAKYGDTGIEELAFLINSREASRIFTSYGTPDPPELMMGSDISCFEMTLDRNTLVNRLRDWAVSDWGLSANDIASLSKSSITSSENQSESERPLRLTDVQKEIFLTISASTSRITQEEILLAMRRKRWDAPWLPSKQLHLFSKTLVWSITARQKGAVVFFSLTRVGRTLLR